MDDILNGLAEGFFALDVGWRFTAFNRAAGLRREDVIGKVLWEISPATIGRDWRRVSGRD